MISAQNLRTNYWRTFIESKQKPVFNYDEVIDTLFIYFYVEEKDRIITHFVDEYFAFLFRYSDKEIIGIRISDFQKGFIRQLRKSKIWKLSETSEKIQGIGELLLCLQENKDILDHRSIPIEKELELEPVFA